jgi:two-component system chemotaxis response regulator CheY
VVDDDSFIRSVIAKAFEPHAKVMMYQDGMNIVETYLDLLPDVVFLDIHMPSISGIDVLKEIIEFDDSAHIVMISIDSSSDNVLAAKKLGAKGFARKPFTKEKLYLTYNKSPTVNRKIEVKA